MLKQQIVDIADEANRLILEHAPAAARSAARAVGCLAASAALWAGPSVVYGVEHAEIESSIGQFPARVSFTGDSTSRLDLEPIGTLYLDKSSHGIGLKARITALPDINPLQLTSKETISTYGAAFEPAALDETAAGYVRLLKQDAVDKAIRHGELPIGLSGLLAFGVLTAYQRCSKQPLSVDAVSGKRLALTAAVLAGSVSTILTSTAYADFQTATPPAKQVIYPFAGRQDVYVDTPALDTVIERAVPTYRKIMKSNTEELATFQHTVDVTMDAQLLNVTTPRPGDQAVWLESDEHSNVPMTAVRQRVYDHLVSLNAGHQPVVVISAGDRTYGTPAESRYEKAQREIFGKTDIFGAQGNHDEGRSKQSDANGYLGSNGKPVTVSGTKVLSIDDPTHTPLFGAEYLEPGITEASVGEAARQTAEKNRPDFTVLHEGYAMQHFLKVNADMRQFMGQPDSAFSNIPYDDGMEDVPSKAEVYGHWHRDLVPPKVEYNSDGSWSVTFEVGSSGGAKSIASLTSFRTAHQPPAQTAESIIATRNTSTGLITSYQYVLTAPDGTMRITPRTDIGTVNGQPYKVETKIVDGKPLTIYSQPTE